MKKLRKYRKQDIVYIDESGIESGIAPKKAWGKKGKAIQDKKSGKFYRRTNIIAGLCNGEVYAPYIYNNTSNTESFNKWLQEGLLPELKAGQVVVMDNASFHKSQKTIDLIHEAGCEVLFLPAYSPDLNPIEKFWANLKTWLRSHIRLFESLNLALENFFAYHSAFTDCGF